MCSLCALLRFHQPCSQGSLSTAVWCAPEGPGPSADPALCRQMSGHAPEQGMQEKLVTAGSLHFAHLPASARHGCAQQLRCCPGLYCLQPCRGCLLQHGKAARCLSGHCTRQQVLLEAIFGHSHCHCSSADWLRYVQQSPTYLHPAGPSGSARPPVRPGHAVPAAWRPLCGDCSAWRGMRLSSWKMQPSGCQAGCPPSMLPSGRPRATPTLRQLAHQRFCQPEGT